MKKLLNRVYDENHTNICSLDMCLPDTDCPYPIFIYFHGGGIEGGSKEDYTLN